MGNEGLKLVQVNRSSELISVAGCGIFLQKIMIILWRVRSAIGVRK